MARKKEGRARPRMAGEVGEAEAEAEAKMRRHDGDGGHTTKLWLRDV